jgi:hypothetical protein
MKGIVFSLLVSLPAWALPHLAGTDMRNGQAFYWSAAKHSVVVFLSPQCPCSVSHEPVLADLARQYPQIPFVGVVSNASAGIDKHYATMPFPILQESAHVWADGFGALNTPHVFLVNADGKVVYQGGVDDSRDVARAKRGYLAEALSEVSQDKPVSVNASRPLGCAIRR